MERNMEKSQKTCPVSIRPVLNEAFDGRRTSAPSIDSGGNTSGETKRVWVHT